MKPRLYLVDAHAYLHRAYHAMPPLTNAQGEPVGALFGFAKMLRQLVKREKPDRVAVCFDTPGPTFRHKAYKDYKATRKEIDPDLISQLKQAKSVAEAMGFTCIEAPGFEADDIMATLARRSVKDGLQAVLVTGDKDALQLVSPPSIRVLKDVNTSAWMDPAQIEEKFGVGPEHVLDYLSIVGDTSDNVPGVRGVGPVGAAKLIKQFGDARTILKAAKAGDPSIKPGTAKAIVDSEKELLAALELIKLEENVPVHVKPDDCRLPEPDPATVQKVLGHFGFTSLIKELIGSRDEGETSAAGADEVERPTQGGGGNAAPSVAVLERPSVASDIKEVAFVKLSKSLEKASAITVTASRGVGQADLFDEVIPLALGTESGEVAVLEAHEAKKSRAELAKILSSKSLKVGYDIKETEGALDRLGLELGAHRFDTMIAAYCLNPLRARPDAAAKGDWRGPLLARAARALGREELLKKMKDAGVLKLFDEVEMPLVKVLHEMEKEGIAVDEKYLKKLSAEFEKDIDTLQKEVDKLAGAPINVNSPKQLGELLFDKLGLQVVHKTAKGGRSTDEETLQILAAHHAIPAKVLEYRELSKLKSTYVDALLQHADESGRVHTHFEQTGSETGRLSSLNPNLQNIPVRSEAGQRVRRAFIAEKGQTLVSADYSQIDLRVLAHVSGDKALNDAFSHDTDIHTRTAAEVFHVTPSEVDKELRRRAKAVNFGIVYGQTAFGLANQLGIPNKEAAEIIQKYFARYPGVSRWIVENLEAAKRDGFVRTFLGRIRYMPELSAKNTALRQFGERAARNTPIQGGSADIIKLAMLRVSEGLKKSEFKARMLLQIHDELLFELPAAEVKEFAHWVKGIMERAATLSVPLVVDVKSGPNWQDMEKVK